MRPGWMDISQSMWICQVGGGEQEDCDASNDGSEDDWSGQNSWSGGEGGVEKMKRRKEGMWCSRELENICISALQSRTKNEISIRSRYREETPEPLRFETTSHVNPLSPLHSQGGPPGGSISACLFPPFSSLCNCTNCSDQRKGR